MMLISNDGKRFAFNKRELAVLTSVMADSEREALAALWLHPSKGQTWATDGHRAVLAERGLAAAKGSTQRKPVAIPAATAHHAAKTARARDLVVIDIGGTGSRSTYANPRPRTTRSKPSSSSTGEPARNTP